MKKMQRNNNSGFHSLSRSVGITLLFLLMLAGLFIGRSQPREVLKEGEVSLRSLYAPFDFSVEYDVDGIKVSEEIKKNELIVSRGQKINRRNIELIKEINARQRSLADPLFILGTGIIVAVISVIAVVYLRRYQGEVYADTESVFLVGTLALLILITARFISASSFYTYLIPLPAVAMLIAMLAGPIAAMQMNTVLSLVIGLILRNSFNHTAVFLIGGSVGILLVDKARRRSQVLKAGFGVGLVQFLSIAALGLGGKFNYRLFFNEGMWGLINGVGCAFIVLGSLPIFEYLFRLVSDITLLELSDLNNPLLKDMISKAPGTYHHSLVVGNLSETAAEAIGANSLLARVGAYYHDIGKIDKAEYFSENQPQPRSKHSKLTPALSSLVIINHIKEGVERAKRHKLNRKVVDIIEQHHGTSKVYYFYQRALLEGEDEKDVEGRFCYPGPKPKSTEAAIVLLADSVEAASRTLSEPTPASIRNLVKRIVNNKFVDGQLSDCNLTLKDINIISGCFVNILTGIFHTRVEYTEVDKGIKNGDRNSQPAKEDSSKPKENKNQDRGDSKDAGA